MVEKTEDGLRRCPYHAEGYPAGEMKHGPNALIDETLPVVCIATKDPSDPSSVLKYEKTLSNIQEVTARSGRVIAIAIEGDDHIGQLVEHVIHIPQSHELLLPILEVVPLQLLACHIAVRRGCDVYQPRNLAKSVVAQHGSIGKAHALFGAQLPQLLVEMNERLVA